MECSVRNCFNRADGDGGVILYAFPQNLEKRKQWTEAVDCDMGEPDESAAVCSVHFDNASFLPGSQPPRLSDEAVPSVLKAQKVYRKSKSMTSNKKFQLRQRNRPNNKLNKHILKKTSLGMLYILFREQRLKGIIEREKKISRSRLTEIRRLKAKNSILSAQFSALSGVVRTRAWTEGAVDITTNAADADLEDETDKSRDVSALREIPLC